jgi:hypothetical protein
MGLAFMPASAGAATNNISTIAGNHTAGFKGDGGPASAAELSLPISVTPTPDGGYLIADQSNNRVRRVAPDGTITTVAGNGTAGFTGNGGPATQAELNAPSDAAPLPDGSVLIADSNNNMVRRVAPDGTITTVVGTGAASFSGDGGPATRATLAFPSDIDVASDGTYYISDNDNNRIRAVSPGGIISTVAGDGTAGGGGDGGKATSAQLSGPSSVGLIAGGGFLIAEVDGNRVRRVGSDGVISRVAGTGTAGGLGDGGLATSAELNQPGRVASASDGGFLIADTNNNRIRRVSPAGVISTVAGTGTAGALGDGGVATSAQLNRPFGVAINAEGDYLIADTVNNTIRAVDAADAPPPPVPPPPVPPPPVAPPPSPPLPSVGRPSVTSVNPPTVRSSTAAGFSGSVNPEGSSTSAHFVFGLDARYRGAGASGIVYDQSTATAPVGSDFAAHQVSLSATGLVPNALYHVKLVATSAAGTTSGPDQTFMTGKDQAPPPPVLGRQVNVVPIKGLVFIKPPPGKAITAGQFGSAFTKGTGFVPLTEARQVPSGSQIDARRGTLSLVTATSTRRGKIQSVTLGGGLFTSVQARGAPQKGLTTLTLIEGAFKGAPSFGGCGAHAAVDGGPDGGPLARTALSRRVLQTLHASDRHGRFRTRGRYSAGTVRGTQWDTSDRCDGTLTTVHRGTVDVFDFARRKTIAVHAGHHYLAKANSKRAAKGK